MLEQKDSIFDMLEMLLAKDEQALIKLSLERASFFHSPEGAAYADVQHRGHRRTVEVKSGGEFERWLTHCFFTEKKKAPGSGAMKNAIFARWPRTRSMRAKSTTFICVSLNRTGGSTSISQTRNIKSSKLMLLDGVS
jgi:hypothetical protein